MAAEAPRGMWIDAAERLSLAMRALDTEEYAVAIRESQAATERIVKSLLDGLEVPYTRKRRGGKEVIPHDVSRYVPKAYQTLRSRLDPAEIFHTKTTLARAAVLLRLLSSIKDYSDWSMKEMDLSGKELFGAAFAKDLSKTLVDLVQSSFINVQTVMSKHIFRPV